MSAWQGRLLLKTPTLLLVSWCLLSLPACPCLTVVAVMSRPMQSHDHLGTVNGPTEAVEQALPGQTLLSCMPQVSCYMLTA